MDTTAERRRIDYRASILTTRGHAAEVRPCALRAQLLRRWEERFRRLLARRLALRPMEAWR